MLVVEFILAIIVLAIAADRCVVGATHLARHWRWSPLIAGVLLVGFGTSLPEIIVSLLAALKHQAGLSLGNALGSNLVNIGLVLGVTAILRPIAIAKNAIKRDMLILLLATIVVGVLLCFSHWTYWQGIVLLALLALYLFWMLRGNKNDAVAEELAAEYQQKSKKTMPVWQASVWWFLGLLFLFLSSEWLLHIALIWAKLWQLSPAVVGLTIVAIGTSLPELAATVMSAIKQEHDIALGNVLGSSVYNLLAVMALPALLSPNKLPAQLLTRAYPAVLLMTILLLLLAVFPASGRIGRIKGVILLLIFIVFTAWQLM